MATTPLIITADDNTPLGSVTDYDLDLDYGWGDSTNDFTLTVRNSSVQPQSGGLIYIDGTDVGGIVDRLKDDVTRGAASLTWSGRTWSGVLRGKILEPDAGQDYYTAAGSITNVLKDVIARVDLNGLFEVKDGADVEVSGYKFDRYTDAWSGLSKLLRSSGLKLEFKEFNGRIQVRAVAIANHTQDSDQISFTVEKTYRRVNHIVGLGKGTLRNRKVVNYYADEDGNISTFQTFTGADEITAVYEDAQEDDTDQSYGPDVTSNGLTKAQNNAINAYDKRRATANKTISGYQTRVKGYQKKIADLQAELKKAKTMAQEQSIERQIAAQNKYLEAEQKCITDKQAQINKLNSDQKSQKQAYLNENTKRKNGEITKFNDHVIAKLKEQQGEGTVTVTIPSGLVLDIGDLVHGRDNETGITVDAQVSRKIVKADRGLVDCTYEVGTDSSTTGGSLGSTGFSSSGVVYTAGSGVHISGGIITTDVTKGDLDTTNGNVTTVQNQLQQLRQTVLQNQNEINQLKNNPQSGGAVDVSNQIYTEDYGWSYRRYAYKIGNVIVFIFRCFYQGSSFYLGAWQSQALMSMGWQIENNDGEFIYACGTNHPGNLGIKVNGNAISLVAFNDTTVENPTWIEGSIAWRCNS